MTPANISEAAPPSREVQEMSDSQDIAKLMLFKMNEIIYV